MAWNTLARLQDEGAWDFTQWQPRITDSTDFDTFVGRIVTRAAKQVEWRVGATVYATTDTTVQAVLEEAELCLGQYYLLVAAAGISDSSDNSDQNPALAAGDRLRADARLYKERFEEIVSAYDTIGRRGRRPTATYNPTTEEQVPSLEAEVAFEEPT